MSSEPTPYIAQPVQQGQYPAPQYGGSAEQTTDGQSSPQPAMASGQPMVAEVVPGQMGQPVMGQPVYSQAPYAAYGAGPGYAPAYAGGPGYAVVMAQPIYSAQVPMGQAYGAQPMGQPYGAQPMGQAYSAQPMGQPYVAPQQQQRVFTGAWSDGLCDCGPEACMAFILAPVRFAFTISRAGLGSLWGSGLLYAFFWVGAIACAVLGFLGLGTGIGILVGWIGTSTIGYIFRVRLRGKYQIRGDYCTDLLYHYFCQCCALAQEGRHVDRSIGLVV